MSLRQKGIDIRFANFIKSYFSYTGYKLNKELTPSGLMSIVIENQLYKKTMEIIAELRPIENENFTSEEKLVKLCDSICKQFHFSNLYLFTVNQSQKKIEMAYSYPSRSGKLMPINTPFITNLISKKHQVKCAETIKSYFQINFPGLEFYPLSGDGQVIHLLYFLPKYDSHNREGQGKNEIRQSYIKMFGLIFSFFMNSPTIKNFKTLKKITSKKEVTSASVPNATPPKKFYLYQRLASQLPLLVGDGEEVEQAVKFLLKFAHFFEVVVCDRNLNKVDGIYSLIHPEHNQIKGNMPGDLKKMFLQAEKKNLARKLKINSGKYLLIFFVKPIHPQKKLPELPFPSYPDTLGKILIKRSVSLKKK